MEKTEQAPDQNAEKAALKRLFTTLFPEIVTQEQFLAQFERVLEGNKAAFDRTRSALAELGRELRADNNLDLAGIRTALQSVVDKAIERLNEKEATVDKAVARVNEAVANIHDGESPDPDAIRDQILAAIQAPHFHEAFRDTPQDVRNKLEVLNGSERLNASAIDGLEDLVKKLLPKPQPQVISGGIIGRDLIQDIDLSAQLDGVKKTFNIPVVWNIVSVSLSSFPTVLRKNVDYTFTPTSITFTDEVSAAATLAAGQTCVLTVVTG